MPSGITTSGQFSNLLARDFDKIFYDDYNRYEPFWSKYANVRSSTADRIKGGTIAGLKVLADMTEGSPVPFEILKQGSNKSVFFTNIGLGVQITQNAMEDDQQGILKRAPEALSQAAKYTLETKFWDIFNNGFTTKRHAVDDSVALFSTAHTRIDYATSGANSTTAAALSETSLGALIDTFYALTNEKGIPVKVVPKKLLIPYNLVRTASRLLDSEYRPGVSDNDINALKTTVGLTYEVIPYFSSTTAYFLIADDHDLFFAWRRQLKPQMSDEFNTGNLLYKLTGRMACDFFSWIGVAGNAGA